MDQPQHEPHQSHRMTPPDSIPTSREAEQSVLAAMMTAPASFMDPALLRLREDHFHHLDTQTLFVELRAMADASRVIELTNITAWLSEKQVLPKIGGPSAVTEYFTNFYTDTAAFDQWVATLNDRLARRTILTACAEARALALDTTRDWKEAMQAADSEMAILQVFEQQGQAVPMRQVMDEVIHDLELAERNKGRIRGIQTGILDLDRTINGLEAPDLFFIGARPGMGKTNILLRIMEAMTFSLVGEHQVPTLLSLEMSRLQIGRRSLMSAGAVEQSKAKTGFFAHGELMQLSRTAQTWSQTHLHVDDTGELTIADIRARIRAAKRKHDIQVVLIDYVQIIEPITKAGKGDERLGIKEVIAGLKAAAKQSNVVIIALAQAGRGSEDNPGKKPTLRDFDGSSAIDKWGDYAAFIHRPCKFIPWERLKENQQDYYGDETAYLEAAELLLVKSRHSSEAVIPLRFIGPLARFENVTTKLYSNNQDHRQKGYTAGDGTGKKTKSKPSDLDETFPD
jgi:replicative DNA helicase